MRGNIVMQKQSEGNLGDHVPAWHMKPGYLQGPVYDNMFIYGVLLLALASGMTVLEKPEIFKYILFLDLWFLGYHHVIATFTKLGGTAADRKENRFLIFYLPWIVLGGTVALFLLLGIWAIVTVYFFWQWYHYTRQSYGISAFYRRKSRTSSHTPVKLEHAVLWAFPVWGLIHRCSQGWDTFLFQPVWLPELPNFLNVLAGAIALIILIIWSATKIADWRSGCLTRARIGYLLSHHTIFFVSYIYISDITIGWLVINIWHNAQYILFVWLFNKNRFEQKEDKQLREGNDKAWLGWFAQPKPFRIMAYFSTSLILTSVFYKTIEQVLDFISAGDVAFFTAALIVVYQTVNFHHYIVDSLIWKARKSTHRKIMKVG